jgi:hypothetical protein
MVTPETPIEHIRGETFKLAGKVLKNGQPKDLTAGDILYFTLAKSDRATPAGAAYQLTSPNSAITLLPTGRWRVRLDASLFTRQALPDNLYWVQVDLYDASSGDTVCIGRGELTLYDNPRV